MKKIFRKKVVLLLTLVVAGYLSYCGWYIASGQEAKQRVKTVAAQSPGCNVDAGQLLTLINGQRSKLGAPILTIDPALATSSKAKFDDMVANQYFGHDRIDGTPWYSLLDRTKVSGKASEDIEMGDLSPTKQWESFRKSPNHYKSLTNPAYTRVGISTSCVDVHILHETGPDIEGGIEGKDTTDITVVHLAAPEPTSQPVVKSYYQQQHTSCIPNPYTGLVVCN
jgi:hypothetical protein